MTFYLVLRIMPKHLLDDLCAMHLVISVGHRARDGQYRHAVHKNQVVHTTNRSPFGAIVCVPTHPSQSVITTKQVFTLFLFFYISNTTLEPLDSPSPYIWSPLQVQGALGTYSCTPCELYPCPLFIIPSMPTSFPLHPASFEEQPSSPLTPIPESPQLPGSFSSPSSPVVTSTCSGKIYTKPSC